jgi:transketolase
MEKKRLQSVAQQLRKWSLLMTTEAGSGHPTTCFSAAELMAVLWLEELRLNPEDPHDESSDEFVLSKGHAAPIYYAALAERGLLEREKLLTLRQLGSPLEGHPVPRLPWVKVATGSLGQGLAIGVGMAWVQRLDGSKARTYVLLGDGETAEGSVWESAALAAHERLGNLCAVVDVNALGQSGRTMQDHDMPAIRAKWEAFGWEALAINGHDIDAIRRAFSAAKRTRGRPTVILAKTYKGAGISATRDKEGWHGKAFKKGPELDIALAELKDAQESGIPYAGPPTQARPVPIIHKLPPPAYRLGDEVATREAYGAALVKLGRASTAVAVLDAEVKNSTYAERFLQAFPDRFIECYIAEQNMLGMAMGLQAKGYIPFCSTFAAFMSRAVDFARMAVYGRANLKLCGSHAGISIGEDGPSQMALEDLAWARALLGSVVLYPADAVACERLTEAAARHPGIVYLRTARQKSKVLYKNETEFPIGGSKTLLQGRKDDVALIGAGVTVYESLKAAELLAKRGISARVIDAYSIKPLDEATIRKAAEHTGRVVTAEDHAVQGGLGEAVAAAIAGTGAKLTLLGVKDIPTSGKGEELRHAYGIDAEAIAKAALGGRR